MFRCASFFAGVGGIDLGFRKAGFQTVYANEIDACAAETFECNYSIEVDRRDINTIPVSDIPDFDILLAGFPCQAFSVAGYRQGFNDEKGRGDLFFRLTKIIREKAELGKQPRICFLKTSKTLSVTMAETLSA